MSLFAARRTMALTLMAWTLACSSGNKPPPLQPGQCHTTNDCPQGDECASIVSGVGKCQLIPCGGKCTASEVCIANSCRNANGVDCSTDPSRCPMGFTCTSTGRCRQNCTDDSMCPMGWTCDVNNFVCTQCTFNSDCPAAAAPICDSNSGSCVGCMATADCQKNGVPNGMICDSGSETCQLGCNSIADCPTGTRTCQSSTSGMPGTCIQCEANTDCFSSSMSVCNTRTNLCVQCLQDSDCTGVSTRCDTNNYTCVACIHDLDCGDGKICNQKTFTCEDGCSGGYGDAMCPPPTTVCKTATGTNGTCVQCVKDSDCQYQQVCDTSNNTCVSGCHTDEQCIPPAGATPTMMKDKTCDPKKDNGMGACVQCRMNSDCPTGLECDPMLEVCRCKGIGEACTSTSQCGYSPDLGGPDYGCDDASRSANHAMCVTSINCNQSPAQTVTISASVCVMAGQNQGIPDQCPNGSSSPGDPSGCPTGYVVELASDGTTGPDGSPLYYAVCVPGEAPFACTNTCFSSPF